MRCVFSATLNGSTLEHGREAPPGGAAIIRAGTRIMRGTSRIASNVLDDVIATLFPADCKACRSPLLRASLTPVCDCCVARIVEQTTALCGRCGEAFDADLESDRFQEHSAEEPLEGLLCTPCRLAPPEFERAAAFGVYQDEMRELLHLLKYERMRGVAKPLGAMLARAITSLALSGDVCVVAVPLYPAKERQRGYNQTILLAAEALKLLQSEKGLRLLAEHGVLRRVRDTESQFALSPVGRRRNLRGAFAISDQHGLAGRTVLLVDDIYTTGATARECARVLRRAGAARVFVATLARAQPERAARWDWQAEKSTANGRRS